MRRITALLWFSVALVMFLAPEHATAAVQTFGPSADTHVDEARPKKSFGTAELLRVSAGSQSAKEVYIRFAVADLSGPVTRATLRFHVASGTPNGPAIYETAGWPSNLLTWARRPAIVSGPRDDKGPLVGGSWAEWDVTPWVTGDGPYRFALKGGAADAAGLMSRETSLQPQLVVTTSDPSSSVEYVAPAAGAKVSGVTPVRVQAPAGTDWIGVYSGYCPGNSIGEDQEPDANGEFVVQWDTTLCQNAQQANVETFAFAADGTQLGSKSIFVAIDNEAQPPPPDPGSCEPTATPGPISGQGYTQRFADCFDTLDRSTWCSNQWWEPAAPFGSQTVAGGELRLRRDRSTGYANTTMTTEPCGQANPKSFQFGYFEARMRHETVQGNGPAFWLLSTRHATNPAWPNINPVCAQQGLPRAHCLVSELDVFEGFGRIQYGGTRQDDFFSGALHRNTGDMYGEPNQFRFVQRGTGLEMEEWHVYAARWTPTQVSFYIDGQLQGSVNTFDSTAQPMHLLLYNWTTGWEDENVPNSTTEPELDVFVDWVRVWQQ